MSGSPIDEGTCVELIISQSIASSSSATEEYTPDSGDKVIVEQFSAVAVNAGDIMSLLIWNYNHATESEENIWGFSGGAIMPFKKQITNTDGTRKLALRCVNDCSETVFASAYVKLRVF